ncbi:glycosyltransferase [Salegentibacter salegens]|uniref:Glycosyltransferase involved in cell wall bisynthesis n=1 Tax=Salegentibacter salegens TaxID=143223 RepID=A0A1M7NJE4_9FLAO|nr:glycosyltransferase [Salegentibacter salegens]PRX39839.1 glycosyltransferase involved in cell wall biosynthesis [Salegentibacter salegens]SHN03938.1 Glycosyltransferase involved in cell wall bisynthesis [Salegentibacter salegens]
MIKNKILILSSAQFGYSTTTYKYCEYSLEQFEITYLCWDYNLPRIELPSVTVKYISRDSSLLKRNFTLLHTFHKEIQNGYDLIFLTYVRGISFIKILNLNSRFLMYIDTFGVMANAKKRWVYDAILKLEVSFYSNVAVISDGLAKRLGRKKYEILPLGGMCFNNEPKSFEKLELLYVGTLENRRIIDCVKGFHKYLIKYEIEQNGVIFKIIGDSPNHELEEIRQYVKSNNLLETIHLIGYVPQKELNPYFKSANIGVSFVPMESYFEYQPPTKTFEYLISGLPVIATGTYENRKLITSWAGVIINDNADAFCEGIAKLQSKKIDFCSERIRKEYSKYTWKKAVASHFIPIIKNLTSN